MKSKALKCFILASTLAFFNCGDATDSLTDAANSIQAGVDNSQGGEGSSVPGDVTSSGSIGDGAGDNTSSASAIPESFTGDMPGSSGSTQPLSNNSGEIIASSAAGGDVLPSSSADALPASSGAVVPGSSTNTAPGSSAQVTPASSETATPGSSSSEEVKPESGIFLAEGTEEEKNYMEVEYIRNTADNGGGVLCYPKQLSSTKKHAVVLWGPGGGSSPNDYEGIIRRLASHGFVVVATSESPEGTGRGKPALDWLAKKNSTQGDVLYDKLDMTKVGASGHSMGGLQSEQMAIADDRVITAFLNNSGGFNHNEMTRISPTKTVAVVYGEGGMERPNAEGDYNNNNVKAPACLIKMTGGQGNECQNGECGYGHGSGPWDGMAATVAWMRWHLGGEDWRKDDFVGTTGKYIDGPIIGKRGKWKGQCKNF